MSLFTALRDGRYPRNNTARKARRGLGHAWSVRSRAARLQAISRVEILENRLLMAAYVSTDQLDYAPGTVATFTASNDILDGANFAFDGVDGPEVIEFRVTRTDGAEEFASGDIPFRVQDNVGGFESHLDLTGAFFIAPDRDDTPGVVQATWDVEPQYAGAALLLAATGLDSNAAASAAFTDSSFTSTAAGGAWNSPSTWLQGAVPTASDAVTITSGATVTMPAGVLGGAASLQIGGAGGGATGKLVFNSGSRLNVSGNVTVGSSTQSGNLTMSSGGTLSVGATLTLTSGLSTFIPGAGTIEYNGSSQGVASAAYNNLTLSGTGTKTAAGSFSVAGSLGLVAVTLDTGSTGTASLLGSVNVSSSSTISGNVNLGTGGTRSFNVSSGNTLNASAVVTGSTGIYFVGGGTLKLTGTSANAYTGQLWIANGTLSLSKSAGVAALSGPIVVGDTGGIGVLTIDTNDQIADTATVDVHNTGQVKLNAASERIAELYCFGGPTGGTSCWPVAARSRWETRRTTATQAPSAARAV